MKYLSDYTQEAQTKLFEEQGAFFAFNQEQFEEGKAKHPEVKDWVNVGMGMIAPSENVKAILDGIDNISKLGIEQDLADNGREGVLERELGNYEIGYSWEGIHDLNFRSGIEGYGFTEEEIATAYKKHMATHEY